MIQGIIGKKIGMTQLFTDDGLVIPVTMIQAGPCLVIQKKTVAPGKPGRAQLGFVEPRQVKHVNKPMQGHFAKANVPPTRRLREFAVDEDGPALGASVGVDIFSESEIVSVCGATKGKGFQGVVRRHGFAGGRSSHGSMFHRAIGSAGSNTYPGEVIKGKGMPGRMGGRRKTVRGLEVVKVDKEHNVLMVRGAVPGFNGNYLYVLKDSRKRR